MTRQLQPINGRIGSQYPVNESDLVDKTVTQHAFVPILEQRGTRKRWYHVGSGIEHTERNVGRFSADIQVADDTDGTGQEDAIGRARWAVYPDEPDRSEPKATGDEFTLAQLRDLDALDYADKAMLPAMKPGVQQDEYLVLEVMIDESQEAMTTYSDGSSLTAVLSERKVR